jgi:hypothetical protein
MLEKTCEWGTKLNLRGRKVVAAGFFTPGIPGGCRFCGVISSDVVDGSNPMIFRTGRTPSQAISLSSLLILFFHQKLANLMFYSHFISITKKVHPFWFPSSFERLINFTDILKNASSELPRQIIFSSSFGYLNNTSNKLTNVSILAAILCRGLLLSTSA